MYLDPRRAQRECCGAELTSNRTNLERSEGASPMHVHVQASLCDYKCLSKFRTTPERRPTEAAQAMIGLATTYTHE